MIEQIISVLLIASHPAAGNHFAAFAEELEKNHILHKVYVSEAAALPFEQKAIPHTNFWPAGMQSPLRLLPEAASEALAEQILDQNIGATHVIVDVGQPFMEVVLEKLKDKAPAVLRIAYYDNPEAFVPGGYSETAARIMKLADKVFFANSRLAENPFHGLQEEQKVGVGYYPLEQIQEYARGREEGPRMQNLSLFQHAQGCLVKDKKIAVYFGGANAIYYQQAFPAFLDMLAQACLEVDLSNHLFVLQQHPRAKEDGNCDANYLRQWQATAPALAPMFVVSQMNFAQALSIADQALYFQTGSSAQFILLGIPSFQVGIPYEDLAVKSGLAASFTEGSSLGKALCCSAAISPTAEEQERICTLLGIKKNWAQIFLCSLKETAANASAGEVD